MDIDDYKCLLNFNPEYPNLGSSGIRGVAIYTKETLKVEEVEMEVEGCKDHAWIEIHTANGESLSCGCVYRSPSNDSTIDERTQSTNAVINLIKKAYQRNHNLFIVGDFNYKDIDWCNDYAPLEQQHLTDFIEVLQNCFLYQHVTEPTRYRQNEKSNILDLILSSEEGMVQDLTYHPTLDESDHVSLELNVCFTPGHNVYKTNYGAIKAELNQQVWEELLNSKFENDYDMFFEKLHTAMEIKANSKSKENIYMTNRAMRLKNKKRRLWIGYLASKSRYDRNNYIKCKNDLQELTRKLRRDYEQELARIAKSKPKAFWKYSK